MTLDEYLTLMSDEYFSICQDKSVLEIGPYDGIHTKLIVNHSPKYLELIEPNTKISENLRSIAGVDSLIIDDAFFILKDKHPADVVVCCGVLYHLHSPLYLLELITNHCNPEYIILDCATDQKSISFLREADNIPGNRQLILNWRSAGYNLVAPFNIVAQSMNNMGYTLIKKHEFGEDIEWKSKENFWVGLWKRT
jgi:hypothetical protein